MAPKSLWGKTMNRLQIVMLLMMLCVLLTPFSSMSVVSMNERYAIDTVVAFLNMYYGTTMDLFDHSVYHKCELNYYGNISVACNTEDEQLDMIEFELDPKTGSIIYWSFYDTSSGIHYVNSVPTETILAKEEAIEIAMRWVNSENDEILDRSYKQGVYLIGPSQNTVINTTEWRIEFWGDEYEFSVALDAKNGTVTYYRCDAFDLSADRMTRTLISIETDVFPEETKQYCCELLLDGCIIGTIDAYIVNGGVENAYIFVVPLLEFIEAIGGRILDYSERPSFEYNKTVYAFDRMHHDLMPARRFEDYGLLGAKKDTPRLYCRLYDDLYIDIILLQSFAMESLNIDIALKTVELWDR